MLCVSFPFVHFYVFGKARRFIYKLFSSPNRLRYKIWKYTPPHTSSAPAILTAPTGRGSSKTNRPRTLQICYHMTATAPTQRKSQTIRTTRLKPSCAEICRCFFLSELYSLSARFFYCFVIRIFALPHTLRAATLAPLFNQNNPLEYTPELLGQQVDRFPETKVPLTPPPLPPPASERQTLDRYRISNYGGIPYRNCSVLSRHLSSIL